MSGVGQPAGGGGGASELHACVADFQVFSSTPGGAGGVPCSPPGGGPWWPSCLPGAPGGGPCAGAGTPCSVRHCAKASPPGGVPGASEPDAGAALLDETADDAVLELLGAESLLDEHPTTPPTSATAVALKTARRI